MTSKKQFNPWLIVLGVVGCSGMVITVLCNTAGLFLAPVMEESGWSRTDVSLYMTIFAWVAAAIQPIVGKFLSNHDPRPVMTGIVLIFGGSYIWSSFFTHLWQWNLFGVIYGVTAAFFMYMIPPLLINSWFKNRVGFALSLSGVITSIFGFFVNPWIQGMIDASGWRSARLYTGVITTVVCLVLTVLFVRKPPEQLGMKAYGEDDSIDTTSDEGSTVQNQTGLTLQQAFRTPAFYLMLILSFLTVLTPSLIQQLSSYAGSVPIGAAVGAFALSIFSISGLPRGPIAGAFMDKFGSKLGNAVCYLLCAVGMVLILMGGGQNAMLFYVGVIFFGFSFVPLTLGMPLLVKDVFGSRDYSRIFSWSNTIILIAGGVAPLIFAQIYDRTGSYTGCLYMVLIVSVIQALFVPLIAATAKSK